MIIAKLKTNYKKVLCGFIFTNEPFVATNARIIHLKHTIKKNIPVLMLRTYSVFILPILRDLLEIK